MLQSTGRSTSRSPAELRRSSTSTRSPDRSRASRSDEPPLLWVGCAQAKGARTVPSSGKTPAAIEVEPRPGGRWARQKQGTKRAASLHDTQAAAIAAGREQAQREGAELIIKGEDGRIRERDSHGRD